MLLSPSIQYVELLGAKHDTPRDMTLQARLTQEQTPGGSICRHRFSSSHTDAEATFHVHPINLTASAQRFGRTFAIDAQRR